MLAMTSTVLNTERISIASACCKTFLCKQDLNLEFVSEGFDLKCKLNLIFVSFSDACHLQHTYKFKLEPNFVSTSERSDLQCKYDAKVNLNFVSFSSGCHLQYKYKAKPDPDIVSVYEGWNLQSKYYDILNPNFVSVSKRFDLQCRYNSKLNHNYCVHQREL